MKSDFPLSNQVANSMSALQIPILLSSNHMQLAAQVPSTWFHSQESFQAASLAIKKVVYRAMLEPRLKFMQEYEEAETITSPRARLGRLNDKIYDSFDIFLQAASDKMGIDLSDRHLTELSISSKYPNGITFDDGNIRRLEVFHAFRCLLGPAIESLILLDRYLWVQKRLEVHSPSCDSPHSSGQNPLHEKSMELEVRLINIFDQKADSGRNVAIVLMPK